MRTLFQMPKPRRISASAKQLVLLDLIALRDGRPLGELPTAQRVTLRRLMLKELVQCVALGPAIYVVTPVGRMVRSRT
jgi:hypothetical protein